MGRFPDNSKVCFVGDSFIAQNFFLPNIIDFYNSNFRNANIKFVNCGTAGGTAGFALEHFQEDVLIHNPTHVVVFFGINDSNRWLLGYPKGQERYDSLKQSFQNYKKNLEKLCKEIKSNNIELILCTPAPYAEYDESEIDSLKGGYALMSEYANYVRQLSKEQGIPLFDFHVHMAELMQTESVFNADHVHPTEKGYYYMAKYFLEFQGLSIGEQKPMPAYFDNWRRELKDLRDIYSAECLIIKNNASTVMEKLDYIKEYLKCDTKSGFYEILAKKYLINKPKQDEILKRVSEIYENEIHCHYL